MKRIPAYLLAGLVVLLLLHIWGIQTDNRRLERDLRNETARHDTTRQVAHGTFVRMAIEERHLSGLSSDLRSARGEVVFLAEQVRVLYSIVSRQATPARRDGLTWAWGPTDMKYGTLTGTIDTRDSVPTFAPTWQPKPLEFSFAVIRHTDGPWEALVRVQPYDTTARVEISQPPRVTSDLVATSRPVCRHWWTIICDGSLSAGLASSNSLDDSWTGAAAIYQTSLIGIKDLRASAQLTTEPRFQLFVGYRFLH